MLEIEAWYYWAIDGRNHTSGWRMAVSPLHCCYLESRSSHWKHLSITCSAFPFRFEYMWHIPGFTGRPSVEYGLFDIKMEWCEGFTSLRAFILEMIIVKREREKTLILSLLKATEFQSMENSCFQTSNYSEISAEEFWEVSLKIGESVGSYVCSKWFKGAVTLSQY